MSLPAVRGVLVDLDDTLYPQQEFLGLAWSAVAEHGARLGLPRDRLAAALAAAAEAGSARGGIIDEAVRRVGGPAAAVPSLVAAFHEVRPARLTPYPGVRDALRELRARVPVAVVTDGAVDGQRAKLAALGGAGQFDAVVLSDGWGRAFRKPHPRPFRTALALLGVAPAEAVMIGDRPEKDIAGAAGVGVRGIRVRTGEYRAAPDHRDTWLSVGGLADAVAALTPHLAQDRPARAATVA